MSEQITNKKSRKDCIEEITRLRNKLREDELREPQIFVTDVTPEAMESALAEQKERIALLTDEGNLFDILSGIYSSGKQNLDVFLKGHAGGSVRVKRQGRVHDLNKIAISIGLAIQPGVLKGIADKDGRKFREKGLLARFLPYLPKSNIGSRDVQARKAIPTEVKERYHEGIKALLNIRPNFNEHGVEIPKMVTLTQEALVRWQQFSQYIESKQGEGNPFESLQDFTGKLPGAALRIVALCHVADQYAPALESGSNTMSSSSSLSLIEEEIKSIDNKRIETVQDVCEKLIIHTQSAFDLMGDDPVIADAKYALNWILSNAKSDNSDEEEAERAANKFKVDVNASAWFIRQNALHKSPRFKNSKLERLTNSLEVLEQRHIISGQYKLATKKPTYIYWVNPAVMSLKGLQNGLA